MSEPPSPTSPSAAAASAGDVLERRKTEVIRKLAAHVPSDDGDPIRLKKLGIIEKVLTSFEDPNMGFEYLKEINNFLRYQYQPLNPALAYLDNVDQRLQLLKDIKSTKMRREENVNLPWKYLPAPLITVNVWAAFMAAPIEALQGLLRRSIWGQARIQRYQRQHGYDENEISQRESNQRGENVLDGPPNMLSLNYIVHHRWDKAQIAFEPIEKPDEHTIRVRLHILQDTKLRPSKRKRDDEFQWQHDLAQDPREILKPFPDSYASRAPLDIRLVSSVTQHLVRDGYIFDIKSETPRLLPSYDLLDLQYRICLMATLIGAGQTPDEYLAEFDPDNDGQAHLSNSTEILVDQWFQRLETEVADPATAVTERLEEERAIRAAWGEPS
ncbi:hypothetical protein CH35J_009244 [Colletotrichum higginsianum]|uniref:HNH nuclease domain-containing protein n=1 Tax=Colletotrichum higginsianum TaxID=80884 RepID=A0A4T0VNX3_9PEZI|nr:hypothetical protein CH35J_009244 [Colletotrichum higginsianum]